MHEIYLDNSATTRVDDDIAALCLTLMTEDYGNPASLHKKGLQAERHVDAARRKLSAALGCREDEIVFTSGGTEANNLAVFGGVAAMARQGKTLVSAAWEHSSVLGPLRELERRGCALRLVNPEADGNMDVERIADAVDEDTVFVSCMLVNSEVGAIADIFRLVKLVRRKSPKALIHCDAVQAFGKIDFSAKKLDVDLLTISGHKIHAPKGIGALYVRKGCRIAPVMFGGENTLRPGTLPAQLIAAFGAAAESAGARLAANLEKAGALREYFVKKSATIPALCINSPACATPYICNLSAPGYRSEILLHYLAAKGIYVSSGSACSRGRPSHVLAAMGLSRERIDSALRVSFSRYSTEGDIDAFFDALCKGLKEIKV